MEIAKGQPLQLTIVAEGAAPMQYKWFKGTRELEYCSDSVLSVSSASPIDSGQYCCAVSNDYGSVLSDIVQVKVVHNRNPLPPITPHGRCCSAYTCVNIRCRGSGPVASFLQSPQISESCITTHKVKGCFGVFWK